MHLNLKVKDFRAIAQADISLGEITVVAGINGSGKSTLSKLFYYILKNINQYQTLVADEVLSLLSPYMDILSEMERIVESCSKEDDGKTNSKRFSFLLFRDTVNNYLKHGEVNKCRHHIQYICDHYLDACFEVGGSYRNEKTKRVASLIQATLPAAAAHDDEKVLIENLNKELMSILDDFDYNGMLRPSKLLHGKLQSVFETNVLAHCSMSEYDALVFGAAEQSVPFMHDIRRCIYIDTPMSVGLLGISANAPDYWNELNDMLARKVSNDFLTNDIIDSISHVIHGDVSYNNRFLEFIGDDGGRYSIAECATGVKAFSILLQLLKNGYINDKTLLILDEPEAHLHPQWIVEYARLIIKMNKTIGCKFFLTSHSPDMVSALRNIAEKEDCLSSVLFYASELKEGEKDKYVVNNCGNDIEPIFATFNKSMDMVDAIMNA